MPATEQFDITYTGTSLEGNPEDLVLTLTVETGTQTIGGFTGHLITAISGTLNGVAVTLLPTGSHGYDGNDNLFSPTGQHFDINGFAFSAGGDQFNLYDNGKPPLVSYGLTDKLGNAVVDNGTLTVTTPVCFAAGTRILTARGEVAVEDLAVGDLAVTASGETRPIVWLGHRRIKRPAHDSWPVRVAAGAFGENRPARELMLSPGHAVCVKVMDEVFVPVSLMINGATVARVQVPEVTYWHVELESHDVLMAEGLGCESYMDAGNRAWFAGGKGAADPERTAASLAAYARPFVAEGPAIMAIRQQMTSRAEGLGWRQTSDLDLHLVVDGERIPPVIDGDLACFIFPAAAQNAVLASRVFSPAWTGRSDDGRDLGLMVTSFDITDGLRLQRRIAPDHPALGKGFHDPERDGEAAWRWTDGQAVLPASLWDGCKGQVILTLAFNAAGWAWSAPAAPAKPVKAAKPRLRAVT